MHTEIEERILEINQNDIIEKLESLGAQKIGEYHYKRYVYDFNPIRKGEWIRLRSNGEKSTLTYKNILDNSIAGTKELEVEVDDFEKTNQLLNILGYTPRSFQENKRISYILNGVEIDIDSWPLIPAYLELESDSIEKLKHVEKKLELNDNEITTLNCQDIYMEKYDININDIKELRF